MKIWTVIYESVQANSTEKSLNVLAPLDELSCCRYSGMPAWICSLAFLLRKLWSTFFVPISYTANLFLSSVDVWFCCWNSGLPLSCRGNSGSFSKAEVSYSCGCAATTQSTIWGSKKGFSALLLGMIIYKYHWDQSLLTILIIQKSRKEDVCIIGVIMKRVRVCRYQLRFTRSHWPPKSRSDELFKTDGHNFYFFFENLALINPNESNWARQFPHI